MMLKLKSRNRAFGLVEVVVGAAIIAGLIIGGAAALTRLAKTAEATWRQTKAAFLLEEGAEVVRLFRDTGWANVRDLVPGTDYYLIWDGAGFATSTTPEPVDSVFTRVVRTAEVYRDGNSDIAPSGTPDADTRLVTLEVSWTGLNGVGEELTMPFYITNLFNN